MTPLEIQEAAVLSASDTEILRLSSRVAGVISLPRVTDDILKSNYIVGFLDVLQNQNSTLTYTQRQQIVMALLSLTNL